MVPQGMAWRTEFVRNLTIIDPNSVLSNNLAYGLGIRLRLSNSEYVTTLKGKSWCPQISPLGVANMGGLLNDSNSNEADCSNGQYIHMFKLILIETEDMDFVKVRIYVERDNLPTCIKHPEIRSGYLRRWVRILAYIH